MFFSFLLTAGPGSRFNFSFFFFTFFLFSLIASFPLGDKFKLIPFTIWDRLNWNSRQFIKFIMRTNLPEGCQQLKATIYTNHILGDLLIIEQNTTGQWESANHDNLYTLGPLESDEFFSGDEKIPLVMSHKKLTSSTCSQTGLIVFGWRHFSGLAHHINYSA